MYIGNGMLEIVLGIMAAKIFTEKTGTMLNLSHFFYGLSSMLAPLFSAWLISLKTGGGTLGWRGMYAVALSLSLLPILLVPFSKFPKMQEEHHEQKTPFKEYIKNPISWLVVFILSFGVITEMTIGGWLSTILKNPLVFGHVGVRRAFRDFLCFMLARLLSGRLLTASACKSLIT
jgi:fucose permease